MTDPVEIMARAMYGRRTDVQEWERESENTRRMWLRDATAALRALDAAGYAIVPREPTRAMWAAMGDVIVSHRQRHHDKVSGDVWTAALAAAPGVGCERAQAIARSSPQRRRHLGRSCRFRRLCPP